MRPHSKGSTELPSRITTAQVKRIWAGLNALGTKENGIREEICEYSEKGSLHDLTREEADRLILSLEDRVKEISGKATPKEAPAAAPAAAPRAREVIPLDVSPKAPSDMITEAQKDFILSLAGRLRSDCGWDHERIDAWFVKYQKVYALSGLTKKKARGVITAFLKILERGRKEQPEGGDIQ